MGLDQRAPLHLDLARRIGERWLGAVGVDVEPALGELLIADIRCGRHQVAHIDLAAAAEHHAIAVDDHHSASALDLALDFTGARVGVIDAVEQGPVGLLLEVDSGVAPDVKGLPIEDGLVGGLLDAHRGLATGLALGRALGVDPTLGEAVVYLQAALAQAIGNRRDLPQRCLAPRRLRGLLGGNRRNAVVERAQ
ncbi:hypothetical protein GCM10009091_20280 [Pseudomonas brenneri]|nr:hypothetical protein GCM10009091_20280 [Pseudomonas brenneri]